MKLREPQLTDAQIDFLLQEVQNSLDCGADHPLFQTCATKLRGIKVARLHNSNSQSMTAGVTK